MLLAILFWVILVLAIISAFLPSTWPYAARAMGGAWAALFVIIGLRIFRVSLSLLLLCSLLCSCVTDSGDPIKDRRGRVTNAVGAEIFNALVQFGLGTGRNLIAGQNGQDAAQAAFVSASTGIDGVAAFEHVMSAYAGPKVAEVAAQQFAKANPQTPAQKSFVANTIGAALQLAANQLAK